MKKIFLSAAVLTMFAFASCKKDYTCECVVSDGQGSNSTSSITIHESKKDAESACKASNSTVSSGGMTMTSTCSIK